MAERDRKRYTVGESFKLFLLIKALIIKLLIVDLMWNLSLIVKMIQHVKKVM